MSYTTPTLFFGQGTSLNFTTILTLPAAVYQSPNAAGLTLDNFLGSLKNSLRTLLALANNSGTDASVHSAAVRGMIEAQLVTDKAFVNAFISEVAVTYGLNIGDEGQSIALTVTVRVGGISRQFFYSNVNANKGLLLGARSYGNARDTAIA